MCSSPSMRRLTQTCSTTGAAPMGSSHEAVHSVHGSGTVATGPSSVPVHDWRTRRDSEPSLSCRDAGEVRRLRRAAAQGAHLNEYMLSGRRGRNHHWSPNISKPSTTASSCLANSLCTMLLCGLSGNAMSPLACVNLMRSPILKGAFGTRMSSKLNMKSES